MPPRARRILLRIFAFGTLVYLGLVGFIMVSETTMVYPGVRADRRSRSVPDSTAGFAWDTLRVKSADGAPVFLVVSRLAAGVPRPWALFFHGNAGYTASRGSLERYRMLREAGFNVVAMEFRGFGISDSAGTPSSTLLAADAMAAWNYMTRDLGAVASRTLVYGWSLGGGIATELATAVQPGALVTEGTFTSVAAMGGSRFWWLPIGLIARNRFDNIDHARTLAIPWVIFHGRDDDVVPFSHGEALAAAAKSAKFVPLTSGHNDGVTADRLTALASLRQLAELLGR